MLLHRSFRLDTRNRMPPLVFYVHSAADMGSLGFSLLRRSLWFLHSLSTLSLVDFCLKSGNPSVRNLETYPLDLLGIVVPSFVRQKEQSPYLCIFLTSFCSCSWIKPFRNFWNIYCYYSNPTCSCETTDDVYRSFK